VWKATDQRLDREVAVKLLLAEHPPPPVGRGAVVRGAPPARGPRPSGPAAPPGPGPAVRPG
ncbi:hypothetical protein ACFV61_34240, partial [Kitasatospora sp. NPDC059817]